MEFRLSGRKKLIDCECHGKSIPAIVCGHLTNNNGQPLGFIENSDDPEDLQAWCYACEYLYNSEQDLTDKFRAFNDMSVVCVKCYQNIKSSHAIAM